MRGEPEVLGVIRLSVLDDSDRATLGVDERALDRLACLQVERRSPGRNAARAVVVIARDGAEIERRCRVVLRRGVGPGIRPSTTICSPSPMDPAASPVKTKLPAEPSGSVCFSTMILPRFTFVNVQVTCSLGPTLIVAVRVVDVT